MPRRHNSAIPAVSRKTLLEWIDFDDGDTTGFARPACTLQAQALHARILLDANGGSEAPEPLEPPSALRLAPLG